MMQDFSNERFEKMQEEITLFSEMGILPVKKLNGILASISTALADLRAYIQEHGFESPEEEIWFFKYEKPRFYCEQIYALELFAIESQPPSPDEELLRSRLNQELKFIQRFFEQYKFFYQYFQLDASDLDDRYFLRNGGLSVMLVTEVVDRDPGFATSGDYLFAKFIAYERLQETLIKKLFPAAVDAPSYTALKWTGDTINLCELGYGIWLTGQVSHGNASVTEILDLLGAVFQVRIGRPYRRWTEISQRKNISPTKYTDQMRDAIMKRIDEELSLKRRKNRKPDHF